MNTAWAPEAKAWGGLLPGFYLPLSRSADSPYLRAKHAAGSLEPIPATSPGVGDAALGDEVCFHHYQWDLNYSNQSADPDRSISYLFLGNQRCRCCSP